MNDTRELVEETLYRILFEIYFKELKTHTDEKAKLLYADSKADAMKKPLAKALIAAGVILPKFKVGQEVWEVYGFWDVAEMCPHCKRKENVLKHDICKATVNAIKISDKVEYYVKNELGDDDYWAKEENCYATEAEALAALEGK